LKKQNTGLLKFKLIVFFFNFVFKFKKLIFDSNILLYLGKFFKALFSFKENKLNLLVLKKKLKKEFEL
jgi:hypothetical protein